MGYFSRKKMENECEKREAFGDSKKKEANDMIKSLSEDVEKNYPLLFKTSFFKDSINNLYYCNRNFGSYYSIEEMEENYSDIKERIEDIKNHLDEYEKIVESNIADFESFAKSGKKFFVAESLIKPMFFEKSRCLCFSENICYYDDEKKFKCFALSNLFDNGTGGTFNFSAYDYKVKAMDEKEFNEYADYRLEIFKINDEFVLHDKYAALKCLFENDNLN